MISHSPAAGADLAIAPNVWITGDIAALPPARTRALIEHWRPARQHGMHVARAIQGEARLPSWSNWNAAWR